MAEITEKSAVTNATANANSKTIKPGLRADVMRKLMETKNTLTKKGSIYVGTGSKETVTVGSDTCDIYETAPLDPPSDGGFFLMSDSTNGLAYTTADTLQYGRSVTLPNKSSSRVLYSAKAVYSPYGLYTDDNGDVSCGKYAKLYSWDGSTGTPYGSLTLGQYSKAFGQITLYDNDTTSSISINGSDGTISTFGGISTTDTIEGASFNAKSDRRLKENLTPLERPEGLLDLPLYEYDYKDGGAHSLGCMAQDLKEIAPLLVDENEDGYLSVKESKLVYYLLMEVRALRDEVKALKEGK